MTNLAKDLSNDNASLHYFEFAIDDSHLHLISSSNDNSSDWIGWGNDILSNLRPLKLHVCLARPS